MTCGTAKMKKILDVIQLSCYNCIVQKFYD